MIGLIGRIGLIRHIKAALVGVALFKAFFDEGEYLVVAEAEPGFRDEVAWWYFAGETFDYDVWVEALDEIDDKFDIIFKCKQMKIIGVSEIFVGHFCVFEYLQLMKFHCCERQFGDDVCCVKHHLAGLAWESEYEVGATVKAVAVDEFDGVAGGGEGVAAVDAK